MDTWEYEHERIEVRKGNLKQKGLVGGIREMCKFRLGEYYFDWIVYNFLINYRASVLAIGICLA